MPFVKNPSVKNFKALGKTLTQWNALKGTVQQHLDTNDNQEKLDVTIIRALNADLLDPKIWNEVKKELNINDI